MGFGGKSNEPTWLPFIVGGLSGMGAAAATHPIDLLKVRMQLYGESGKEMGRVGLFKTAVLIAKDGPLAFYKGLSASLLRQATYTTTRFGAYDFFKDQLTKGQQTQVLPLYQKVVVSVAAGCVGAIVGTPSDVVMVRMQADGKQPVELRRNYKNVFDGLFRIVREEGIFNMFRGCTPNVVRGGLMTAGQIASYDQAKQMMLQSGFFKDNISTHFIASFFASIVATTVTSPVDVVKTRVMTASNLYSGTLDCFVKTFRNEGIGAFYKGYLPYSLRLGPQTILTFIFAEQLNKMFAKILR
eukprot:Phypoly_transcript_12811.p1 GENE.Phypoly_transcript_12811~~Phypoly_transcript_12811.p1  ORF type:complete len:298 (+),score=35.64 Phypoly_transcript_12811:154-1047(+)